jgi:hypothetical protein
MAKPDLDSANHGKFCSAGPTARDALAALDHQCGAPSGNSKKETAWQWHAVNTALSASMAGYEGFPLAALGRINPYVPDRLNGSVASPDKLDLD